MLVLGTLWPQFWDELTGRPDRRRRSACSGAELLAGHDITVPSAFTPAQLRRTQPGGRPAAGVAAGPAPDGQVTQFLAGVPALLARYRNAPPAARALIDAAMDARRLGSAAALPHALLEAAAPGYLTDDQWDALGEDWLEQALAYAAAPCHGVRGPLTRIRPRPASRASGSRAGQYPADGRPAAHCTGSRTTSTSTAARAAAPVPPAGILGRRRRSRRAHDQAVLADAAYGRGLYRDAAQLYKNAVSGNLSAALYLADLSGGLRTDPALRTGPPPTPPSTTRTAWPGSWGACGRRARTSRPPRCWPVTRPPTPPSATRTAWPDCWTACGRRARTSRPLPWPAGPPPTPPTTTRPRWPGCWTACGRRARTSRPLPWPAGPPPTPPTATRTAWPTCWTACGGAGAESSRPPRCWPAVPAAHAALSDPYGVASLLDSLREAGADEQAAALLARGPAAQAALSDPYGVASLLDSLREAGADEQAAALLARDPAAHVSLGDEYGVSSLRDSLREAGADEQATALLTRDPVSLGDPAAVASLLDSLMWVGADEQAAALLARSGRPRPPWRHGRRGQPAGQPAAGGRGRAGRRAAGP